MCRLEFDDLAPPPAPQRQSCMHQKRADAWSADRGCCRPAADTNIDKGGGRAVAGPSSRRSRATERVSSFFLLSMDPCERSIVRWKGGLR